jgi:hypothetical protein
LTEIGVLLFIVKIDNGDLQRLLSHFILTSYVLDYRLSMPKDNVKKTQVLVLAITAALVLMATPMLLPAAFAAPRLHAQDCDVVNNNLVCEFDVSGLGGAETATATLTGDATITTGCVNRGGNEPSGLERETVDVLETQTVNVEGGRATFEFETDFDPAELRDCPSRNMTPVIVCAEFTNLELEVVPSSGPSRTFDIPDEGSC